MVDGAKRTYGIFFWIYEPAPDFYFPNIGKYWNDGADLTFRSWKLSLSLIQTLPQPADMAASVPIKSTRGSWTCPSRGAWTWIARCMAKQLTRNIKRDPAISLKEWT